ncbi:All-trans-phytoene synthase [Rosistilla ulvae]|uniref:All-trans-phytoene synthase n=1 Tax=Rosistilla ulvae TaxID=1930277 RepID=A0A517LW75_9BACT|nr:squalene synthase HpnC [Rosistilla ulvae]QDS86872.1 All-trans-phytoene synthase [Rosistilla ulvae]
MPSPASPLENPNAAPPSLAESQAYCRRYARARRENFVVASCCLPRDLRQDFYNLYTYCRTADDLADEIASPAESLYLLDLWQQQLESCYDDQPPHIAFVALQSTIERFSIPREPFLDLLTAFRRDQDQSRYATQEELADYCRYSANPVGHLILHLADAFDSSRASLSDSICTGLQLANHWQDVGEDFRRGRIYLPQDRCEALGVTEAMLAAPTASTELKALVSEQVEIASRLFEDGRPLLEHVPRWLRLDLELILAGGEAALQAIRDADFDILGNRCKVPLKTRFAWVARTAWLQWSAR